MYRKTRDTMVTTINSVPGLTGSSQGKSGSLYRPPRSCTHPHTKYGYTYSSTNSTLTQ